MLQRILAGRYQLLEHIGGGGMADVYKAHDKLLDRAVAVKILHQQLANDIEFVDKFNKEATGAAKLTHPNIVNIYDVGEDAGSQYMVMEYVAGPTLKQVIQEKGALEPVIALQIAKEIAMALEFAHKNNLIHCDIKPHNILIMEDGHVKVTDFGIARAVSSSTMTYGGNIMGSVHYFSPEQAKGSMITTKTDVYSLGVVLYEMLTGNVPYNGETSISIALKHLQEEPASIRSINPSLPAIAEAIVQKAMAKDAMLRPDSHELYNDISQGLHLLSSKMAPVEMEDPYATRMIPKISEELLKETEHKISSDKERKRERLQEAKGIFASKKIFFALIPILMVGFVAGLFLSYGKFWSSVEVDVPNVSGKLVADGQRILEDNNFKVAIVEDFNVSVPEGRIISQYPEAGSRVKEQRTITLTVSKGGEEIEMPDLKGISRKNAENKLDRMGLSVGKLEEQHDKSEPGTILSQKPAPGEKIRKGQGIELVVSLGEKKQEVTLQNYIGLPKDRGESNLKANKLSLGSVTSKESSAPEGTIIEQSPAAGAVLKEGDPVDFVISGGARGNNSKVNVNVNDKNTTVRSTDNSQKTIKFD